MSSLSIRLLLVPRSVPPPLAAARRGRGGVSRYASRVIRLDGTFAREAKLDPPNYGNERDSASDDPLRRLSDISTDESAKAGESRRGPDEGTGGHPGEPGTIHRNGAPIPPPLGRSRAREERCSASFGGIKPRLAARYGNIRTACNNTALSGPSLSRKRRRGPPRRRSAFRGSRAARAHSHSLVPLAKLRVSRTRAALETGPIV